MTDRPWLRRKVPPDWNLVARLAESCDLGLDLGPMLDAAASKRLFDRRLSAEMYGVLVVLERGGEWSVPMITNALWSGGVAVTQKKINDCLLGLARRGYVVRVGRGIYKRSDRSSENMKEGN